MSDNKITLLSDIFATSGRTISVEQFHKLVTSSSIIRDRIDLIRDTNCQFMRKRRKESLPAVIAYGDFSNGKRCKDISKPNGLMILDYDDIKSPEQAKYVKKVCSEVLGKALVMQFSSPNNGVKIVVQTNCITDDNAEYRFYYKQLLDLMNDTGLVFDSSTSNCNRMCILSHDPNCVLNNDVEPLEFDLNTYQEHKRVREAEMAKTMSRIDLDEINEVRKNASKQKALENFRRYGDFKGKRHYGLYILGKQLFQSGHSLLEVVSIYRSLGSSFTEYCHRGFAQDVHDSWMRDGGYIHTSHKRRKSFI